MEILVIKKENPIILDENPLLFSSYESLSTSEKAELKPIGNSSINIQNIHGVCQYSENNKDFICFQEKEDCLQSKLIFIATLVRL